MRAVKSIILASGALRKEFPDQDEDITVLRAISVCNIPKFIKEDIDQFGGIISDLFPTTPNSPQKYDVLKHFIKQSIVENSLQRNEEFETKTI
jgi:dynein heavy chain